MKNFYIPLQLLVALFVTSCNSDEVASERSDQQSRPNIIFLLTDDQRDNTFAAMGHPFVDTPNVDRLLSKSVRFKNTYTAEPVCSPSRVSLLVGMHERVHGIGFTSAYDLTEEQWDRSYPALLQEAGYFTGFVGKIGIEYYTWKGNAGDKFDYWWGHDGWTKFLPKNFDSQSTNPYHKAKKNIITEIMGEALGDFLDSRPDDKPFCLSVSLNVPHGSQTTSMYPDFGDWRKMARPANENPELQGTRFYDELYRDLDIEIPDETATDPYQFIPRHILDQDEGRKTSTYQYNYTRETNTEHHIRYYQTIAGLDYVIGEFVKDLEERELMDNTIIIYGSDHGLLMGEYGMGGKSLLYDLASKIPCFVYDPHAPASQKGSTSDELVSSLDITRTILDYAGVNALDFMDGTSLQPLVRGETTEWREELFLESLYTGRDNPFQEGIRMGKWKYIRMFEGVKREYNESHFDFAGREPEFEMLFDLEADPPELNNLAGKKEVAGILNTLREKCAAQSIKLNEKRDAFKKVVATTPREKR